MIQNIIKFEKKKNIKLFLFLHIKSNKTKIIYDAFQILPLLFQLF